MQLFVFFDVYVSKKLKFKDIYMKHYVLFLNDPSFLYPSKKLHFY